jgi:pimeloyl-ACP methyl ester carboxylesterase
MAQPVNADRYLDLDGARLRWRMGGEGPPIVLLHGWAMDLGYWDTLAPLLARDFTVLRFDRRGFGLSGGSPDILRNVDDLRALLDAAAMERVAVLGMSQGARLAIHFARSHPERVTRLLLDGPPELEAESELPLDSWRRCLEAQGLAALHTEILRHPLMQLHGGDPVAGQVLRDTISRYRGLDLAHPVARRRPPDLQKIATPTLVINGSLDSVERRRAGAGLRDAIPHARSLELAGAGHLAALDEPQQYARGIRDFLA